MRARRRAALLDAAQVEPGGEIAQLGERAIELPPDAAEVRGIRGPPLGVLEPVRQRRQPFDRLAQASLEPASLLVAGVHQAPARFGQLIELQADLGLEARVCGRQSRCPGQRIRQTRVVQHRRVVHQHRDRLAVLVDTGDLADRPLRRQRKRPSHRVDVASIEPVADLEGGIAERLGERVAQGAGARLAEIDDEVGDLRPRPRLDDESDQERDRQRAQGGLVDQQRCVRQLRGGRGESGGGGARHQCGDERRRSDGGQTSTALAPQRGRSHTATTTKNALSANVATSLDQTA